MRISRDFTIIIQNINWPLVYVSSSEIMYPKRRCSYSRPAPGWRVVPEPSLWSHILVVRDLLRVTEDAGRERMSPEEAADWWGKTSRNSCAIAPRNSSASWTSSFWEGGGKKERNRTLHGHCARTDFNGNEILETENRERPNVKTGYLELKLGCDKWECVQTVFSWLFRKLASSSGG